MLLNLGVMKTIKQNRIISNKIIFFSIQIWTVYYDSTYFISASCITCIVGRDLGSKSFLVCLLLVFFFELCVILRGSGLATPPR